jgi:DNA-binding response OmpR family regulator
VSGRPPAPAPGKSRRLLVVEDEKSLAVTLSDRSSPRDTPWRVRAMGEAALEPSPLPPSTSSSLDVMLPGMDGFGVCMELRRRGFDLPS